MISLHVELIRGFRQSDEFPTGMEQLFAALREFESAQVEVHLSSWNEGWKGRARLIDSSTSQDATIIVVAYSWGVGYGARMLAKHLRARGRRIQRFFSIDGVYHSRWLPWRAVWGPVSEYFLGYPVIQFPDNVGQVDMWRQKLNKPSGHPIKVGEGGWVCDHGLIQRTHENIDEAPEIHDAVTRCVANYVRGS